MMPKKLKEVLSRHALWLTANREGRRANLSAANLLDANLSGANLSGAILSGANILDANLSGANLSGANLSEANLIGANLSGAILSDANLSRANLIGANLSGANLIGAILSGANLLDATLSDANLSGAKLPAFQIPQEGDIICYKKGAQGEIIKLKIPANARRTATPCGRKCRAEYALVLEAPEGAVSAHNKTTAYIVGEIVRPDSYSDDIRVECAPGIHFFLTREEAVAY